MALQQFVVSRPTHWPPLGEGTPCETVSPSTKVQAASDPLSKSSSNTKEADGVVTLAVLLGSDVFPAGSRALTT